MTGIHTKKAEPCPFCGKQLELSGDGTQWRHPGSLSLEGGCLLRGRRIGEDELDQWNHRVLPEEAVF